MALTSLNCFSQTDTVRIKTDTTKVVLSQDVAKQVVKDLIRLDGCEEELKLTQDKVELLKERESEKDSIIQLLTMTDSNSQSIILMKNEQLEISKELTDILSKELKKKKTENFLYKIGSFIGIISTTILIITWP